MNKKKPSLILISITIATLLTTFIIYNSNNNSDNEVNNLTNNENIISPTTEQAHRNVLSLKSLNLPTFSSSVLTGYSTCSELQSDIIEASKYIIQDSIKYNIKGGMTTQAKHKIMYSMPAASPPTGGAESTKSQSTTSSSSEDSYGTNNQVNGVDEADIVKSDGTYIFSVYGKEVIVLDKDSGTIVSRVTIPKLKNTFPKVNYWEYKDNDFSSGSSSWGRSWMPPYYMNEDKIRGLLLDNGRLVVIATSYHYGDTYPKIIGSESTSTFIYEISSNDNSINDTGGELTLVETKELRGSYNSGRSINGKAYITSNTYMDIYKLSLPIDRHNSMFWFMSDEEYEVAAEAIAIEMLPKFAQQLQTELLLTDNGEVVVDENACKFIVKLSFMQPTKQDDDGPNNGLNLLRSFAQVASFDMHSTLFQSQSSISGIMLPTSDMDIYANNDMLIIGARGYENVDGESYWNEYTYLVGFDLIYGLAIPSAVGKVQGYVLNQFSMDHYNNYLRVATATNAKWGIINSKKQKYGEITPSTNQVYILQKQGTEFQIISQVNDLGTTERIYSVRFVQDRGYVVTFRIIDPLYTLDLSQPTNPRVVGELKISGYSNYIHPIDDGNTLLTIGQDADEITGALKGLQISLFDVSDMSNPTLLQKKVVQDSNSDAQYDHHAFRYLPLSKVLIIPVSSYYNSKELFDGFYLYSIDSTKTKTEGIVDKIGEVIHADNSLLSFYKCFSNVYLEPRSLVFDSNLITMKGHSVINSGSILGSDDDQWMMNFDAQNTQSCMDWFPWS